MDRPEALRPARLLTSRHGGKCWPSFMTGPARPSMRPRRSCTTLGRPAVEGGVLLWRKGLEISPLCADAHVPLAREKASTLDEGIDCYRQGLEAGEKAIWEVGFPRACRPFLGCAGNPSYVRAPWSGTGALAQGFARPSRTPLSRDAPSQSRRQSGNPLSPDRLPSCSWP